MDPFKDYLLLMKTKLKLLYLYVKKSDNHFNSHKMMTLWNYQ